MNFFGILRFPNCVLFIGRGACLELSSKNERGLDSSPVLASFAVFSEVASEPVAGARATKRAGSTFGFVMVVLLMFVGHLVDHHRPIFTMDSDGQTSSPLITWSYLLVLQQELDLIAAPVVDALVG